jgi:hypothetical protein
MKKMFILAIIAVVMISGCISQSSNGNVIASGGSGLEISDFSLDKSEVYGGQSLHPQITLENLGQDDVFKDVTFAMLIAPSDWKFIAGPSGALPKEKNKVALSRNLRAANPTTGASSEFTTLRWTIEAPELDKGDERSDSMFAKIYYSYGTESKGKILLYPEAERDDPNKKTSSDSFVTSTGPIDLSVSVIPDPAMAEYVGEYIMLEIVVTNIGDGTAYSQGIITQNNFSISENQRNNISINVRPAGTTLQVMNNSCPTEAHLVDGTATIACDLNITKALDTKESIPITIEAAYGYTIEDEIDVTILGR